MRDDFQLSDEVLKLQEQEDYYIPNEIDLRGKSDQDLSRYLNGRYTLHVIITC